MRSRSARTGALLLVMTMVGCGGGKWEGAVALRDLDARPVPPGINVDALGIVVRCRGGSTR